ncbi:MAG TPA: ATP-binding protein [Candidatus Binatus sp.]|nr:ATP-binding protein [Candidatus Binatus sp.]
MSESVLIVEDERIVAMELEAQMKSLGYRVLGPAPSMTDALRCCETTVPDLALMDIRIQGDRDGVECADALLHRFDVPVIYLTAIADANTIERAKYTQPAGYLIKPVRSDELKAAVEIALFKRHMERMLERQRSEFVALLTHDIRNPLQSISGFAELIEHDLTSDDLASAKELVGRMRESLGHTVELVGEYLKLLNSNGERAVLAKVRLSVNDTLLRLKERYGAAAFRRDVHLETRLTDELPFVEADPLMLERVLTNLLFNALKFTPPAGCVTLSSTARGGEVVISVADTGPGICNENLAKIFEKGWRGVPPSDENGSGLGLFVVKTLVGSLGGRIEVESTVGRGSCFSLFLPSA